MKFVILTLIIVFLMAIISVTLYLVFRAKVMALLHGRSAIYALSKASQCVNKQRG